MNFASKYGVTENLLTKKNKRNTLGKEMRSNSYNPPPPLMMHK